MLTFLTTFSDQVSVFNVFRYITFRTGGALITAALIVFTFGPMIINSLRVRQGKGQPIRADGPQTHFKKAGTPTMGGLMILCGIIGSSLLWANVTSVYVWTVLLVTVGFGLIGLYDDFKKVTRQSHLGLSGRTRLLIETVIAAIAAVVIMRAGQAPFSSSLTFPFLKDLLIDLGWFFVPFTCLVVVGAGNAVNLPDGLDGQSFKDVLLGKAKAFRGEVHASHTGDGEMNRFPQRCVRDGRYKYILNLHPDRTWTTHFTRVDGIPNSHKEVWDSWVEKAKSDPQAARLLAQIVRHPVEELYDTEADPHELTNLAGRPQSRPILERLRRELQTWRKAQGELPE